MRHANVLRPIAIKELRETVGLAAIASLVAFYFVTEHMVGVFPWSTQNDGAFPFVSDTTPGFLFMVAFILAAALGLRQSAWELHAGTYLFLLHRPIERHQVMAIKIVVGLIVYGVSMAVPVLLYAFWAATPGTHASPFFWSMTVPVWQSLLTGVLLYLGSFLSGLGQGRWYVSRLLPLVAMAPVTFVLILLDARWPIVCLGALVVISGLTWLAIMLVSAKREYA